ncbi:MAG: cupredoxin domain-containing protein [Egibacteraceae bacterium]
MPTGTTVSWAIGSPTEGHLITFGQPPFSSLEDPALLAPAGAASGGEYAGGLAHSGLISRDPRFPAQTYALRFTQPGTYRYVCLIHPGMQGDIIVTP